MPTLRADEAQAPAAPQLALEAPQEAPCGLVGPDGDEEAPPRPAGLRRHRRRCRVPRTALTQGQHGLLDGAAGLEQAPLGGQGVARLGRVGVALAGPPQRVQGHVAQFVRDGLEAVGHGLHGFVRPAHRARPGCGAQRGRSLG